MESSEFKEFRAKLGKTQAQMAQLLGVSLKAVHSYEQGWRSVPTAVERQMLKNAARNKKASARPGSSGRVSSAGLSMEPFATVRLRKTGKKK